MNAYSSTVPFTIKLRLHEMYIQYNCCLLAPILSINFKHARLLGKVNQSQNNTFFISKNSLLIMIKIFKEISISLHTQYLLLVININQNWGLSVILVTPCYQS